MLHESLIVPNTPHVVAEDFDNEIIIVNLYNGNYYSLRDTASVIWKLLNQKPDYHALLETTAKAYQLPSGSVAAGLDAFLEQLLKDKMIRLESNGVAHATLEVPAVKGTFEPPKLETYSDMQDLLLLDPIHDVDEEKGWPERKSED